MPDHQIPGGSHRRLNPLTNEWVLVSPQRTRRPWQGQLEPPAPADLTRHDPGCYLCPGNTRHGGRPNPDYRGPWAFDNDFPALDAGTDAEASAHPLFRAEPEPGRCRVVCFSERHDLTLSRMDAGQVTAALAFLFEEFGRLDVEPGIGYVQLFENRGEMMGCSNPHPHAQIWATASLPNEPAKELRGQCAWYDRHGTRLLLDVAAKELDAGERLVTFNDEALSLVPFWATWPFETLLLPRRPVTEPGELDAAALAGFAEVLRKTLAAYDALFNTPMPYSLGFHPRPSDGKPHEEWQFHAHLFPPLLRSATVRKHMVGFELLGSPQRDLTPEVAAERLRRALESGDDGAPEGS
jgi:UDPglucose--hexose-1-phosphate uridylyltransferase